MRKTHIRAVVDLGSGPPPLAGPDGRDAETLGSPTNVESNHVAFVKELDPRLRSTDWRADHSYERKFKWNVFSTVGANQPASARTIELENHARVEVAGETIAVEIVDHD